MYFFGTEYKYKFPKHQYCHFHVFLPSICSRFLKRDRRTRHSLSWTMARSVDKLLGFCNFISCLVSCDLMTCCTPLQARAWGAPALASTSSGAWRRARGARRAASSSTSARRRARGGRRSLTSSSRCLNFEYPYLRLCKSHRKLMMLKRKKGVRCFLCFHRKNYLKKKNYAKKLWSSSDTYRHFEIL